MINFTIDHEKLLAALTRLVTVCDRSALDGKGAVLPCFKYFKFEGYESSFNICAASPTRRAEHLLVHEEDFSGECSETFGLPAGYFYEVVKSFPRGPLSIKVASDQCSLRADGCNFTLQAYPADLFPSPEARGQKDWIRFDCQALYRDLLRISYCANTDDVSNVTYSKAICVAPEYLATTSRYRMSVVPNAALPCEGDPYMVPADSLTCMLPILKEAKLGLVFQDEDQFCLSFDQKFYVRLNLFAGAFPNFLTHIPSGPCILAVVDRDGLINASKRLILAERDRLTGEPSFAQFYFSSEGLTLISSTRGNSSTEILPAIYEETMVSRVALNMFYVVQATKHIRGKNVLFELRGAQHPVIITDEERRHKNVVIPVRI